MAEQDTKLGENDKDLDALQNKIFEEQKARLEQAKVATVEQNTKTPLNPSTSNPDRPTTVIKNLRTFQGDIAEAIKNQNASVLSIAMAEQAKAVRQTSVKQEPSSGPTSFVERIIGKRQEPKPAATAKPLAEAIPLKTQAPSIPKPEPIYQSALKQPEPKKTPPLVTIQPTPRPQAERIVFSPGKEAAKKETAKNVLTIAVSILLIILGIGTVLGFYFIQKKGAGTIVEAPGEITLLSYQAREDITLSGQNPDELGQTLATIRQEKQLPERDTLYLPLAEQISDSTLPITTSRLFSLLRTQIPPSLLRAMESEFMLGMYVLEGNQPFLLIPLSSFENGFDGMLRWEKTMNQDIGELFSSRTIPITEYDQTEGTTTAQTTRLIYVDSEANAEFEDVTIRNKDARILKNTRGDTLILYSFLDQNTLLITSNESVFQEILNKFLSERRAR